MSGLFFFYCSTQPKDHVVAMFCQYELLHWNYEEWFLKISGIPTLLLIYQVNTHPYNMNGSLLYHNENYFIGREEKCKHSKGISLQRNASQSSLCQNPGQYKHNSYKAGFISFRDDCLRLSFFFVSLCIYMPAQDSNSTGTPLHYRFTTCLQWLQSHT